MFSFLHDEKCNPVPCQNSMSLDCAYNFLSDVEATAARAQSDVPNKLGNWKYNLRNCVLNKQESCINFRACVCSFVCVCDLWA